MARNPESRVFTTSRKVNRGMFSKGDVVTIYEDPLTQKKPEGKAKLLSFIGKAINQPLEGWWVQFVDDDFNNPVYRFISIEY